MPASSGGSGDQPRFPIPNTAYLSKAIRAVGRAKPNTPEQRAKVRRYIIKRANALGASDSIPDNWNSDGTLKGGGS
jgi:hypothetical protein